MNDYDWKADSVGCFNLWAQSKRLEGLRLGTIAPRNDEERAYIAAQREVKT